MSDQIEIRLLGRLYVRRANGEVVDPQAWNTGKTADLLRILALNVGTTVSAAGLIETLWPGVADEKAMSSLRTSASLIRKVIGSDCVDRRLGGLALQDCWVDVEAYRAQVADAASAMRSRDFVRVVTIAHEAESLYASDFHAHDDDSLWAGEARDRLRTSRQSLIADAGEAAAALSWWRDAIDFSRLAVLDDPCFERPHRTLMRAHAGLGETDLALRAFAHCRRSLANELGADPSQLTNDLHLRILSGYTNEPEAPRFVGREPLSATIASMLRKAMTKPGIQVVCIAGPPGSGRQSVVRAACTSIPRARLHEFTETAAAPIDSVGLEALLGARRTDLAVWGPLDGDPPTDASHIEQALLGLDPEAEGILIVLTSAKAAHILSTVLPTTRFPVHVCDASVMTTQDHLAIATDVLSARPSTALFDTLMSQNNNLAGRTVAILRDWMGAGGIVSTRGGLDLYDSTSAAAPDRSAGARYRAIVENLEPGDIDLCQLIAVIDRPVTVEEIVGLQIPDRRVNRQLAQIHDRLDRLTDQGVLRMSSHMYEFRSRPMRDVFELWMRPSVRSRLARLVDGVSTGLVAVPVDRRSDGDALATGDRRVGPRGRRASDLR